MKKIFLIIGCILLYILISFGVFCVFWVMVYNAKPVYPEYNVSSSIIEAMKNKTYIKEVKLVPDLIETDSTTIQLKECWIEQATKTEHFLLLFTYKKLINQYYLCLTTQIDNYQFGDVIYKKVGRCDYHNISKVYSFEIVKNQIENINYIEDFINQN